MGNINLMKDPFYAQLVFCIEELVCSADQEALQKGIRLTDSAIKSALNKAMKLTRGESPLLEETDTREAIISKLARNIHLARKNLAEERGQEGGNTERFEIARSDWLKAISTAEESLKIRRTPEPGSRSYLDYVHSFLKKKQV